MNGQELRREERFPASLLPEYLQSMKVMLGGTDAVAQVVDASNNGFGLHVPLPVNQFIVGTSLVLYPYDDYQALYGTIVFAKAQDGETSRVGIQLKEVGLYAEYRKELEQLMALAVSQEP